MLISRSDPEMIRSYRARYIQGCAVAQRSRLSVIIRCNKCESTSFCLLLLLEVLVMIQWRNVTYTIPVLATNAFTPNHNDIIVSIVRSLLMLVSPNEILVYTNLYHYYDVITQTIWRRYFKTFNFVNSAGGIE